MRSTHPTNRRPGRALTRVSLVACIALAATVPAQERKLSRVPKAKIQTAAAEVDRLLDGALRDAGKQANARCDDATFVRRSYLQIVGRIPTAEETHDFLKSTHSDKRSRLVDQLLASKGWASHSYHWIADLLRVKARGRGGVSGAPYAHFVRESLADNKPWDVLVRELLTANGPANARGNGATGYYLRDRGMPEDNMANTVRIFLGTRLECAQCHNHPFDKWTQKQFFEMAAFTGNINYRDTSFRNTESGKRIEAMGREIRREHGRNGARALNRILRGINSGISGTGSGLKRLPHDYQYDDADPHTIVKANTMFGDKAALDVEVPADRRRNNRNRRRRPARRRGRSNFPQIASREAYADWLTSPNNPRFTKVIANRAFKRVFGRGLFEPVDDIKDDTKPSHPKLMSFLEDLMVELDYDLKQFERVLYHSKAFGRVAAPMPAAGTAFYYEGPALRRMSAEQFWDSMLTLVLDDVDATIKAPGAMAEQTYERYESVAQASSSQIMGQVRREILRYKDPEAYRKQVAKERRERSAKLRAERNAQRRKLENARKQKQNRARPLLRKLQQARRRRDSAEIRKLTAQLQKLGYMLDKDERMKRQRRARRRAGRGRVQLARASELSNPAPPGHFLRQFGQSDREQIEASHREANVPQVLALLNGFIERWVSSNDDAKLARSIANAGDAQGKVDVAYLSILNRLPSKREMSIWTADFERDANQAWQDLVWTLVNTHEFKFVR